MFTEQQFIAEVRKVVAENPDFIYPNSFCSYLQCNTACLFGVVLSNLGVTQSYLRTCESKTISIVLRLLKLEFDDDIINWASNIQASQDDGRYTWQQALEMADKKYPGVKNAKN